MMRLALGLLVLLAVGCAPTAGYEHAQDVIFIAPGVDGPAGYSDLADSVAHGGRYVQVVRWGAPTPLFFVNFNDRAVHEDAERQLAGLLEDWRRDNPTGRIDLIGHSAGCGVALGALGRLRDARVHDVILLAPSVSPVYDLNPALARVDGRIHSFFSEKDEAFLRWRTSMFGTYDGVRSPAAGNTGFTGAWPTNKLLQYRYDPRWANLGYDGGHFSIRNYDFGKYVLAPMLE